MSIPKPIDCGLVIAFSLHSLTDVACTGALCPSVFSIEIASLCLPDVFFSFQKI